MQPFGGARLWRKKYVDVKSLARVDSLHLHVQDVSDPLVDALERETQFLKNDFVKFKNRRFFIKTQCHEKNMLKHKQQVTVTTSNLFCSVFSINKDSALFGHPRTDIAKLFL